MASCDTDRAAMFCPVDGSDGERFGCDSMRIRRRWYVEKVAER